MNTSSFIDSGILEAYVLGFATAEESAEVEKLAAIHPEIKNELEQIENSIQQYTSAHTVQPHATIKPLLLATIDYTERLKNGETPGAPLLLHANSKIADYGQWLNRPDMVTSSFDDEIYLKIIGYTPQVTTAIVWIKTMAPDEVHHNEHESFLIVEGTCDITIGDKVHQLVPGDFLSIPLHTDHFVTVTSDIPCKVILERKAA
ncbi:MAG: cupin domain-containing protein [Bacteroidota bacterium]|nr:cupin domain-containing protein [Bacteroidota bacterium]